MSRERKPRFLIVNTSTTDDACRYWSNELGWVSMMSDADEFTEQEKAELRLPMGGQWIDAPLPVRCDQCQLLMINGVCCHETGCPNMGARWDKENGEWIRQRKCFECGCTVDRDDPCCNAEPEPEDDADPPNPVRATHDNEEEWWEED